MGRTSENFTCCLLVFCHLLLDTDAHWHGVPCGHTQKNAADEAQLVHAHQRTREALAVTGWGFSTRRAFLEQDPRPMRISITEQNMDKSLSDPDVDLLRRAADAMMKIISRLFQVRYPPGREGLLVHPLCEGDDGASEIYSLKACASYNRQPQCGQASILEQHLADPSTCEPNRGGGITCRSYRGDLGGEDTDMYLYLTCTEDANCRSGAAAWVIPCLLDMMTNRPVVATVNMCPKTLKDASPDGLVALLIHEIIHAMGFSNTLFDMYINPTTLETKGVDNIRNVKQVDGREVFVIISDTVKREARAQFNCSELEGATFEDEGGSGSANTHWEFTHYQGDVMTATTQSSVAGEPPRISRMTLALMEDTGWYLGNWSAVGGPLQFAREAGCELPQHGCAAVLQKQAQDPPKQSSSSFFCSPPAGSEDFTKCSTSHRSLGQCKTDIQFANGCGMVVSKDNAPTCTLPEMLYPNPLAFGWINSPSSRCFDISLDFKALDQSASSSILTFPAEGGSEHGSRSAACFPSKCTPEGHHMLTIQGYELRCRTGQWLDLAELVPDAFIEALVGPCPDEAEACKTQGCVSCSPLGGFCLEGICQCKLGWEGAGCERSLLGVVSLADSPHNDGFIEGEWYETLEVSFGLDPMEGVSPRQSAKEQGQVLKEAFAAWSRLRSAQIRLTSAEFVRSTRVGQQPAQGEAGNHKDKLFEAGEGGVAQQYKGRRLHQDKSQAEFDFQGLHAVTQEGGNGIEAVTLDDKGNAPTKRQVPAIRHKAEGAELQVTLHVHPAVEDWTTLSARLVSNGELSKLSEALKSQGIRLREGSVSQRLRVVREQAVEFEDNNGNSGEREDGDDQEQAIIIGCVVGVGGALLLAASILASVWWTRAGCKCCPAHPHEVATDKTARAAYLPGKEVDQEAGWSELATTPPSFTSAALAPSTPSKGSPRTSYAQLELHAHLAHHSPSPHSPVCAHGTSLSQTVLPIVSVDPLAAGLGVLSLDAQPPQALAAQHLLPWPPHPRAGAVPHNCGATLASAPGQQGNALLPLPATLPTHALGQCSSPRTERVPVKAYARHAASETFHAPHNDQGSRLQCAGVQKATPELCHSMAQPQTHPLQTPFRASTPQTDSDGFAATALSTAKDCVASTPALIGSLATTVSPRVLSHGQLPHVPHPVPATTSQSTSHASPQHLPQQAPGRQPRKQPQKQASAPQISPHSAHTTPQKGSLQATDADGYRFAYTTPHKKGRAGDAAGGFNFTYATPTKKGPGPRLEAMATSSPIEPPKRPSLLARALHALSPGPKPPSSPLLPAQPAHRASAPQAASNEAETFSYTYAVADSPARRSELLGSSPLGAVSQVLLRAFATPNRVTQQQQYQQQQQWAPGKPAHRASAPQALEDSSYTFSYSKPPDLELAAGKGGRSPGLASGVEALHVSRTFAALAHPGPSSLPPGLVAMSDGPVSRPHSSSSSGGGGGGGSGGSSWSPLATSSRRQAWLPLRRSLPLMGALEDVCEDEE